MRKSALEELAEKRQQQSTRQTGLSEGAKEIVLGVAAHLPHIDYSISSYAERWRIDRMPATDRAILRVATWELLYREDAQAEAIIAEAVKIAGVISTDGSPKYVNGLLDTIASVAVGLRAQEQAFNADENALVAAALAHDDAGAELPDFHDGDDADFAAYGWGDDAGDFSAENTASDADAPLPDAGEGDPTADFSDFGAGLPEEEFAPASPALDRQPAESTADNHEVSGDIARDERRELGDDPDEDTHHAPDLKVSDSDETDLNVTGEVDDRGEGEAEPTASAPVEAAPSDTNGGDVTSSGEDYVQETIEVPLSSQLAANDPTDPQQTSLFSDWES